MRRRRHSSQKARAWEKLLGVHVLDRLAEPAGVEDVELVVPRPRDLPRPSAFD